MEHADEKIQCFFVPHVVYQNDSPTNAATSTALFGLGFDLRFFIPKIMHIVLMKIKYGHNFIEHFNPSSVCICKFYR